VPQLRHRGRETIQRRNHSVPERSCPYFDLSLASAPTPANWTPGSQPASGLISWRGSFVPSQPITIRYRNFQNQERVFTADAGATVARRIIWWLPSHLRVRKLRSPGPHTEPRRSGERPAPGRLSSGQPWPSPSRVSGAGYHKKHGTLPRSIEDSGQVSNWYHASCGSPAPDTREVMARVVPTHFRGQGVLTRRGSVCGPGERNFRTRRCDGSHQMILLAYSLHQHRR